MDLMGIRRRLLMGTKQVLDTTPIILQYDVKNPNGNPSIVGYVAQVGACVTIPYEYTPSSTQQTIVHCYSTGNVVLWQGDTYKDFWNINSYRGTVERRQCINANTTRASLTLVSAHVDDSFAYIEESGEILFAGKNTRYYGHTNISELP